MRLFIIAFQLILLKNMGSLYGQRAVHIYLKILVAADKTLGLNVAEIIQKLLSSAHGKSRNHHIAATIKSLLHNPYQLTDMVGSLLMKPVAIGRLHHGVIGSHRIRGITDQRFIFIANVA